MPAHEMTEVGSSNGKVKLPVTSRIAVVGSGIVGGATGRGFFRRGANVTFVDVRVERLAELRGEGFKALTPDSLDINKADVVFVSVPTPSTPQGFDARYLASASRSIGQSLASVGEKHYPVVVFRSTMLPGMTEGVMLPIIEGESGKKADVDFGICYNPEYLRAVSADDDFYNLRVVTIGHRANDMRSVRILQRAYEPFGATVHLMSIAAAEYHKYCHNVFNAIKIAAFNEFRMLGAAMGISPEEIENIFAVTTTTAEGLYNPTYGTKNFGPFDGECLPKETWALLKEAERLGVPAPMVNAAQEANLLAGGRYPWERPEKSKL